MTTSVKLIGANRPLALGPAPSLDVSGADSLVAERRVNKGAEFGEDTVLVEGNVLRHKNGDHFFLRVHDERGGGRAAPAELPHRPECAPFGEVQPHGSAETKPIRAARIERGSFKESELVHGHKLDGFSAKDAFAIECAAIEQHLTEAEVIVGG